MINEIETRLFWESIKTPKLIENKKMNALITKLEFNSNETKILIGGWISYNGELFESQNNDHVIEVGIDENNQFRKWFISYDEQKKQIIDDTNFIELIKNGVKDYITKKESIYRKIS